jgi:hypothetical protein
MSRSIGIVGWRQAEDEIRTVSSPITLRRSEITCPLAPVPQSDKTCLGFVHREVVSGLKHASKVV